MCLGPVGGLRLAILSLLPVYEVLYEVLSVSSTFIVSCQGARTHNLGLIQPERRSMEVNFLVLSRLIPKISPNAVGAPVSV